MRCAITGQPTASPVVSSKSRRVFDRDLLRKHVEAMSTDPVTGEAMGWDDVIELEEGAQSRVPRIAEVSSVPQALSMLQQEWDASMLEMFDLRKQLEETRQQLSHALYEYDAACRVIARVVRERDEARQALASRPTMVESPAAPRGATLSPEVLEEMVQQATANGKERKNRWKTPPADLIQPSQMSSYDTVARNTLHLTSSPGITAMGLHPTETLAVTGGRDGRIIVFDFNDRTIKSTIKADSHHDSVSSVFYALHSTTLVSSSLDSTIKLWNETTPFQYTQSHSISCDAPIVDSCAHPTHPFFGAATSSAWNLYNMEGDVVQTAASASSGMNSLDIHPDGLLLGAGLDCGTVRLWDVRTAEVASSVRQNSSPIKTLAFCQNGYYLASGSEQGSICVWDLRKMKALHTASTTDGVACVSWNPTGHYLCAARGCGVDVFWAQGDWKEPVLRKDAHHKAVTACRMAQDGTLLTAALDRELVRYGY